MGSPTSFSQTLHLRAQTRPLEYSPNHPWAGIAQNQLPTGAGKPCIWSSLPCKCERRILQIQEANTKVLIGALNPKPNRLKPWLNEQNVSISAWKRSLAANYESDGLNRLLANEQPYQITMPQSIANLTCWSSSWPATKAIAGTMVSNKPTKER